MAKIRFLLLTLALIALIELSHQQARRKKIKIGCLKPPPCICKQAVGTSSPSPTNNEQDSVFPNGQETLSHPRFRYKILNPERPSVSTRNRDSSTKADDEKLSQYSAKTTSGTTSISSTSSSKPDAPKTWATVKPVAAVTFTTVIPDAPGTFTTVMPDAPTTFTAVKLQTTTEPSVTLSTVGSPLSPDVAVASASIKEMSAPRPPKNEVDFSSPQTQGPLQTTPEGSATIAEQEGTKATEKLSITTTVSAAESETPADSVETLEIRNNSEETQDIITRKRRSPLQYFSGPWYDGRGLRRLRLRRCPPPPPCICPPEDTDMNDIN